MMLPSQGYVPNFPHPEIRGALPTYEKVSPLLYRAAALTSAISSAIKVGIKVFVGVRNPPTLPAASLVPLLHHNGNPGAPPLLWLPQGQLVRREDGALRKWL
jgi:hypothetical protein